MMPFYITAFPHLGELSHHGLLMFCEHLSEVAVGDLSHPIQPGWLNEFIARAKPKERATLADRMGHRFFFLDPLEQRTIWDDWLRMYLVQRLHGVPARLNPDEEMAEVLQWSMSLRSLFPEVVDLLKEAPVPSFKNTSILHDLAESQLVQEFPEASAKFVLHLITGQQWPTYFSRQFDRLCENLLSVHAPNITLLEICNRMVELGFPNALMWKDKIEQHPSDNIGNLNLG